MFHCVNELTCKSDGKVNKDTYNINIVFNDMHT